MKFNIIAAIDENNGIGKDGNIPWLSKYSDLSYFKKITLNCDSSSRENVIIMGKNTWNSLPQKPLPNRKNIIISSTLESSSNYNVYTSLDKGLESLKEIYEKINNYKFLYAIEDIILEEIDNEEKINIIKKIINNKNKINITLYYLKN